MAVAFTRSNLPDTEEATLFYGNERDPDSISIKEDDKTAAGATKGLFAWETRSLFRRRILQVVVGTVGLAIVIVIICTFALKDSQGGYTYLGKARFKLEDKVIEFKNAAGKFVLHGEIGLRVKSTLVSRHTKTKSRFKYATEDGIWLVLTQESESSLVVSWRSSQKSTIFMDCLSMKDSHWYGGSELLEQKWPLEKARAKMGQYVPQDLRHLRNRSEDATYGSVLERYWLNSDGMAVLVDYSVPLHVSINVNGNRKLCLKSDPLGYLGQPKSILTYRILSGTNAKTLHLKVIQKFLGKPEEVPSAEISKYPIWVTAKDSANISQKEIEKLGSNIKLKDFPCSHILIEGQYSEKFENYKFDPVRFPSPKVMIKNLVISGCNVSVDVQPHIKIGSREFYQANEKGYLLQNCGRDNVPGLIKWQDNLAACIDMTSQKSKDWFKGQLQKFQQEFGFTSFAFSSGDVTHLPFCYQFHNQSMNPGNFSQHYAKFAANFNGISLHVGYRTQRLPIFVKMADKNSTWDGNTGLKSLIPTVLTFGIIGYPYVLTSVIGGYQDSPERELYVRWMQASVFLPGMQFLKTPWMYDKETRQIVQDLLKLRSSIYPSILEAFRNVTKTGAPVIRPLWWIAPTDREALKIDTEFLLGEHYLIAPILEKGQPQKAVYLPAGKWKESFNKQQKIFDNKKGGQWVKYNVTLKDLLYFKCLALYS